LELESNRLEFLVRAGIKWAGIYGLNRVKYLDGAGVHWARIFGLNCSGNGWNILLVAGIVGWS
jgi:hypothetical protein